MLRSLVFLLVLVTSAACDQDDPEVYMTPTEIIRYWGYPAEEHSATTVDGYILGMHRIPYGRSGPTSSPRPVIFLQHGLESDTISWIANLPEQSGGFVFADAGFDVWMGNARGNTWSKKHVNLTSADEAFWEFSWEQMGDYDLEAMVNYALTVSNQSTLYYVGHSQGTLTMFCKLSTDKAFASKIKKYFALAPIGSVANIQGPMGQLARKFEADAELMYELFGSGQFLGNREVYQLIAKWVCEDEGRGEEACDDILQIIDGPEDSDQFNKSRVDVIVAHNPAGTSTRNIIHWAQLVVNKNVARFDYGTSSKNYKHYGQNTPPLYDFSTITTDMHLYWSDEDWLADMTDVQGYLLPSLNPMYLKESAFVPGFTHIDFIWGLKAAPLIYQPMIETIKADLGGEIKG